MPTDISSAGVFYETFLIFQDSPRSEALIKDDIESIVIERELAGFTQSLRAGSAEFNLFNQHGKYNPRRTDGPYFGKLDPGLRVDLQVVTTSGNGFILDTSALNCGTLGDARVMFTGFIDQIKVNPALSSPRTALIRCRDRFQDLLKSRITTDILTNVNVSSAFTIVLSLAGFTTDQHSVQAIPDEREFVWFKDISLRTALDRLITSGGYSIFVAGDGTINVKDRNFEIGQPVSNSYDNVLGMTFSTTDKDIYNDVKVKGLPRTIANSIQPVAEIQVPISIPASSSIGFFLDYFDPRNLDPTPALNMVTPVASQDYLTNTDSGGTGTDTTSDTAVTVGFLGETAVQTITNQTSGEIWLTKYQLRGDPILKKSPITVREQSATSQARFGIRALDVESDLLSNRAQIENFAEYLVDFYDDPIDDIQLTLKNEFPDIFDNQLASTIHVTNSFMGLDAQFTIESIQHTIDTAQGIEHSARYSLRQSIALEVLILGNSEFGVLNQNRLGR